MAPKAMKKVRAGSPPMKKAKKGDPVKENLDKVLKYLKDSDHCDVQGPETCRDMLIQALPHALGMGAASDERCPFQSNLGGYIGEVISASVAKWQGKVNDAQAVVDAAELEKSQADTALTESATQVESQKKVVEDTKSQSKTNKEAEKEAQKALAVAEAAVANFDSEHEEKVQEKTDSESVFNDCFLVLKGGEWTRKFPKSKLDSVTTLLDSINTDASMMSALPLALQKKVEDRGKFDEMVIASSESLLQDHLKALGDTVANGDSIKATKEAEAEAAKKALESATAKKEASFDAEKFAKEVLNGAQIHEKDAQKSLNSKAAAVTKAKAKHAVEESGLEKAQKVLDCFNFLKDRPAIIPDSDEEAAAPPASPSRLSSFVSAVSGVFSPTKAEPKEETEE